MLTCTMMSLLSITRHNCRHTSRFFSKGVRTTSGSFSSSFAKCLRQSKNISLSCASKVSGLIWLFQCGLRKAKNICGLINQLGRNRTNNKMHYKWLAPRCPHPDILRTERYLRGIFSFPITRASASCLCSGDAAGFLEETVCASNTTIFLLSAVKSRPAIRA